MRSECAAVGDSGFGDLLRHAVDDAHLGRKSGARRRGGSTGRRTWTLPASRGLFRGFSFDELKIWNSHGDHVIDLPAGFAITGKTDNAVASVEHAEKRFYGLEFHPEVNHTDRGTEMLRNFIFSVCGAKKNWSHSGFIAATVDAIRKQAEGARAICALSGGVDSAVAAALVHRAIGDRLTNVFVDTGLLRGNEFHETLELLRERLGLNVIGVDASARFLAKLAGVDRPGAEAEDHRLRVHFDFCGRAEEDSGRSGRIAGEISGAGDFVSGRDRVGVGEGSVAR